MAGALRDLNLVRTFLAVAGARSFTVAAETLGMARPQVSQQIRKLERALGAQLFRRTTRQVALTDSGRALFERCAPLVQGIDDGLGAVGSPPAELTGRIRISAPVDHAAQLIAPAISEFARLHPRLHIELHASDRIQDLIAEGIDVSIRVGWLKDSSMRVTKLGDFHQGVLASRSYLRRKGQILAPAELAEHEWIALTLLRAPLTWTFAKGGERVPVRMTSQIRTDSPTVLRALLIEGAGVSIVNLDVFRRELHTGRLVHVLPEWQLPSGGIYAVFPPGAHVVPASRTFVEHLRAKMQSENWA